MYNVFCHNRTAELYSTFFTLIGSPDPDFSDAKYVPVFTACVPFNQRNAVPISGMAKSGIAHGLVRYEYKGNLIEECRKEGKEHGLRVVCTQVGQIWIRLFSNGKRLAQIVLSSDLSIASSPPPIDEGGLKMLRNNLHLIRECFKDTRNKSVRS